MELHKLYQLLKNDEGFKLDFKRELDLTTESKKKEFVKDVIAIANTPGGRGYIIFGIEDQTRQIVGLQDIPLHIEERIQQVIANRSTPPVPVRFDLLEVEGKKVGVVTIFKSMQVPHQMIQTGAFYVRRGSTTDKAGRHEIANMFQQFGMLSFENVPCRASRMTDLNEPLIQKYMQGLTLKDNKQQLLLATMGVLAADLETECYYPTYGGLLLFGRQPQRFMPQAFIELTVKGEVYGIDGNIIEMLGTLKQLMTKLLPRQYPIEGLLEVVMNAVVHRNYWNNGQYIKVWISEEKIITTNPMSYDMAEEKKQIWRVNPWLYSRLLFMQQQDQFHLGIGLEQAKALLEEGEGLQITRNQTQGSFEVTLPGPCYYRNYDNQTLRQEK